MQVCHCRRPSQVPVSFSSNHPRWLPGVICLLVRLAQVALQTFAKHCLFLNSESKCQAPSCADHDIIIELPQFSVFLQGRRPGSGLFLADTSQYLRTLLLIMLTYRACQTLYLDSFVFKSSQRPSPFDTSAMRTPIKRMYKDACTCTTHACRYTQVVTHHCIRTIGRPQSHHLL